jgi:hypothetical protein
MYENDDQSGTQNIKERIRKNLYTPLRYGFTVFIFMRVKYQNQYEN